MDNAGTGQEEMGGQTKVKEQISRCMRLKRKRKQTKKKETTERRRNIFSFLTHPVIWS